MQKKGKTIPYEVADTFMLRAPLLTSAVIDDISGVDKLEEILRHYYSQSHISEALLLASPDLYQILEQWLNKRWRGRVEYGLLAYRAIRTLVALRVQHGDRWSRLGRYLRSLR